MSPDCNDHHSGSTRLARNGVFCLLAPSASRLLIEPIHRVGVLVANETQFAKTADGTYIAYQVVGAGPVDLAMDFHAFAGNVDLIWDEPTGACS